MLILGIETSCDETALALLRVEEGHGGARLKVLQNLVYSQVAEHEQYGGVVPEMAARLHLEKMSQMLRGLEVDGKSLDFGEIDMIAVTAGPGLSPALRVGVEAAKALAWQLEVPLVPVSHMEGHIYANWIEGNEGEMKEPEFPVLALLVSGGHTELILMEGHGKFERVGETIDDAAGEAFDKVAHMLELPYPGGPQISRLAQDGEIDAFDFPRGMLDRDDYDFSFSGLKTSVLYKLRDNEDQLEDETFRANIAASFEEAVVDVLVKKTKRAIRDFGARTLVVAGGVSANKQLRARVETLAEQEEIHLLVPEFAYTMDNASMIAAAGYFRRREALKGEGIGRLQANSQLDLTA